jgi:hypothetical protein
MIGELLASPVPRKTEGIVMAVFDELGSLFLFALGIKQFPFSCQDHMFFFLNVGMVASGAGFQGILPRYFATFLGICTHHHFLIFFTRAMTGFTPDILF